MGHAHSDPGDPRNAPLRTFVRAHLGADVRIEDASRAVGGMAVVWAVAIADEVTHYVKRNETSFHFGRESYAYEHWVPQLRDVPGVRIPEVVARDDTLGAFIFTALPHGPVASELDATAPQERVHWHAGRFVRALHALPLPEPAPDIIAHMRALIARYVIPHHAHFDRPTFDRMVAVLDEGRPFEGVPFVCAHRDCSPRNWIAAADGTLGVFDWERAQPDVWLADITRMEFDVWPAHPPLRDAFFKGYGTALTERSREQLRLATLIHAVASVAWAAPRGDVHFEALGRATIERLATP